MYASELDVLADGVSDDFTILGHSVHLNLLVVLMEFADNNRMFLADVGSQLEETLQLVLVGTYVHGCTAEHVGRTHQYREPDFLDKLVDVIHRCECSPCWLVNPNAVTHGRELVAVFGIVDALGRGAEDGHTLVVKTHGQVVRNLSTCRDDDAMRILQFDNIHDAFEGQLIEIETVAHIIISRNGLRVVVNHHRTVTVLSDGIKCLNATPIELNT